MPRRALVATSLSAVALAILLSFKTPAPAPTSNSNQVQGSTTKSTYSGQLTGSAVQTPFGTVQVQVTLQNGQITGISALSLPGGGHSSQVSSYAEPQLRSEVLTAQSTAVDTISGATYTSQAYLQSVQSALDQAGSGFTGTTVGQAAPTAAATTATNGTTGGTTGGMTSAATSGTASKTYTGQVAGTAVRFPYGTAQVRVTLQNGKITDIVTITLPNGGRSGQIAQYAAPQLRSEVLAAQSTAVNTISGATYTSQAYLQSVQSALDQAGV